MTTPFLEAFRAKALELNTNLFSVSELRGDGDPVTLSLAETNPCQDVYSVAKAYTVTAVGLLYDRGLLSPDEMITDVLGDDLPAGCDPKWYTTPLDWVLRHHVGLPAGFLDIDAVDANIFGEDFLAYFLSHPLGEDHGTAHHYTDGAFYLAGRLVEKRAGMPLDTFLWKELFYPLGYREAAWSRCPRGYAMGATGLYIRSEDMTKLGAVYMGGGVYHGRRYLSEEWVNLVRARGYELGRVGIRDAFGKGGAFGQMLLIIPEESRVVAWQGFGGDIWPLIRFAADYRGD